MLVLLSPPETEAEKDNLWIGNSSTKLSQRGREAAAEFAKRNLWINPKHVYCANDHLVEFITYLLPETKPTILTELIDRSMGSLTGRSYRETMMEFPRRNWLAWQRSYWTAPPGGESLFDISDRVLTAFRVKILPIPSKETVLVVCAPDVMRLLIGFLTHKEEAEIPQITVEALIPYVVNGDLI
jgi:broad specificity phosphatase PhoE